MKFNEGDYVRVLTHMVVGDEVNGLEFVEGMEEMKGNVYKVDCVDTYDNTYRLYKEESDNYYWFDESWLEKTLPTTDIYFAKVRPDAIIPSKRDEDAGYDIYSNFSEEQIIIQPHETKMIPTGIATAFNSKYVAILKERGSTGTKGIGQRSGIIDSGYRNEIFVPITNHNTKPLIITKESNPVTLEILSQDYIVYPYSKAICQMIIFKLPQLKTKEITYEELKSIESERGTGCLGASGK